GDRKYSDERLLPSGGSGVGWFIENLDDTEIVHWGHEPLAVPRRTESADKSDALQTLRARGRVSGGRVSVWSARVFSAAFPRQATIRWPSRFMEKIRARIQWLLALGLSIQLAGGYCAENPQTTGLHVGAAAVDLEAADTMIIAGGITAGKATGQEGKLRATAVVLEKQPFGKLVIIACD